MTSKQQCQLCSELALTHCAAATCACSQGCCVARSRVIMHGCLQDCLGIAVILTRRPVDVLRDINTGSYGAVALAVDRTTNEQVSL